MLFVFRKGTSFHIDINGFLIVDCCWRPKAAHTPRRVASSVCVCVCARCTLTFFIARGQSLA